MPNGRLFLVGQAAFFILACAPMDHDPFSSDQTSPEPRIDRMRAAFACELRELSATFSWRLQAQAPPRRQRLEVSLFKGLWDPGADAVQVLNVEPGAASGTLRLETDSVYYWRVLAEWPDLAIESDIQQIHTPGCVADFIDGG